MRSHSKEPGLVSGLWKVLIYVNPFPIISFSLPTVLDRDQSPPLGGGKTPSLSGGTAGMAV